MKEWITRPLRDKHDGAGGEEEGREARWKAKRVAVIGKARVWQEKEEDLRARIGVSLRWSSYESAKEGGCTVAR